ILLALVLIFVLPESIRFLVMKGGRRKRVSEYLSRISPGTPIDEDVVAGEDEPQSAASSVGQLFADGRAGCTLLLWTMFFMNLLNLWFLNNWLPTIMNDAGIAIETASLVTSLFQIGGLAGSLLLAGIWGRRLSFGILASTYLAAAVFILLV